MFDADGRLTRPWILFFERTPKASGGGGPYIRTLLLKDTAVGDDIADHVPIFVEGAAVRVVGVLRLPISADLTVRINLDGAALVSITIPSATAVDTPVVASAFTGDHLGDLAVLSWDVVASDGSTDAAGVASFTLQWQ